jgi:hypothetical protein
MKNRPEGHNQYEAPLQENVIRGFRYQLHEDFDTLRELIETLESDVVPNREAIKEHMSAIEKLLPPDPRSEREE